MKHILIGVTAAIAVTGPVWAQAFPPGTPQAWPPAGSCRGRVPARQRRKAERDGKIFRCVIQRQRLETTNCRSGSRCRARHLETVTTSQTRPSCQACGDVEGSPAPDAPGAGLAVIG